MDEYCNPSATGWVPQDPELNSGDRLGVYTRACSGPFSKLGSSVARSLKRAKRIRRPKKGCGLKSLKNPRNGNLSTACPKSSHPLKGVSLLLVPKGIGSKSCAAPAAIRLWELFLCAREQREGAPCVWAALLPAHLLSKVYRQMQIAPTPKPRGLAHAD
jgi:hypothetical protein